MNLINENKALEENDKKYIWHPFTQMQEWLNEKPIIISEGKGCFLKDIYGRWYLDGVSSLWVNIFGHKKKEIDDAIIEQLRNIAHSTLLGLSNVPSIKLAEKLVKILSESFNMGPKRLTKVFYSDNGSTAVEVALKMAFQYWIHIGIKGKNSFISFNNAYHGDTIGAVSVGGIDIFHKTFEPLLFKTYKAPSPYCYRCEFDKTFPECDFTCLKKLDNILESHSHEIAGLIIEPIIQAAGGMITAPKGFLKGVRELCYKYGVLMIADEVATGFGRTGKMFACEHESVVPDIICLSKGITGGYMPLAVTVTTEEIYNAFLGRFEDLKTFFHGHSYTGNPLACSSALAVLDLFEKENLLKTLENKINIFKNWLDSISQLKNVGDTRNAGLMAGIELVKDKKTKEPFPLKEKKGWQVAYKAREKGVILRPLGNVVVVMPPLCIDEINLNTLMNIVKESINEVNKND
jgi:adenosylmethionine-8-amino-7-oxononanoate aminotransferase